jgi:predicted nucleic acid-binding protein
MPKTVRLPKTRQPRPECSDPDDWIFLELADTAGASALVTGDADLLCLRGKVSLTILTAGELKTRLLAGTEQGP